MSDLYKAALRLAGALARAVGRKDLPLSFRPFALEVYHDGPDAMLAGRVGRSPAHLRVVEEHSGFRVRYDVDPPRFTCEPRLTHGEPSCTTKS